MLRARALHGSFPTSLLGEMENGDASFSLQAKEKSLGWRRGNRSMQARENPFQRLDRRAGGGRHGRVTAIAMNDPSPPFPSPSSSPAANR